MTRTARFTLAVSLILFVLAAADVARADDQWWEGWEPKNTLPAQAVETLDRQAVTLIPPVTITAPDPQPEPTSVERWRPLVAVYDWNPDRMLRIMRCESRGDPNAVSPTDDWGLLQIHAPIWAGHFGVTRQQLLDPVVNVDIAFRVYAAQGYGAWVCDRLIR